MPEEQRHIKTRLALLGMTAKQLAIICGIKYQRMTNGLNGFAYFKPEEERLIRKVLDDRENHRANIEIPPHLFKEIIETLTWYERNSGGGGRAMQMKKELQPYYFKGIPE